MDFDSNHVRKLEAQSLEASKNEPLWFVPHHPVIKPNKPEKVRRVCNAASKYKCLALDAKLTSGPDFLQNPMGFIFRLCEYKIAMKADIEATFLQIKVPQLIAKFRNFFRGKISTM